MVYQYLTQKLTGEQNSLQVFKPSELTETGLKDIEILTSLGLTDREARVYLALLKTQPAKARTVASIAAINRQEVYDLLGNLQKRGLVHQNIMVPTTYLATPLTEGIRSLLEQKTNELTRISQKVKQRIQKPPDPGLPSTDAGQPCFGIVFEGSRGKKYLKAIQETRQVIDATSSWIRFKQSCFLFETELKEALKRGVTLNIITEKPPNNLLPKWINTALAKHPNFHLKTQPNPLLAAITIFDNTQTAIAYNPNNHLTKGPDLWTTNPTLKMVCQTYFNTIWIQNENTTVT
jgi:sugar-specific transcriptional regulator TrmB